MPLVISLMALIIPRSRALVNSILVVVSGRLAYPVSLVSLDSMHDSGLRMLSGQKYTTSAIGRQKYARESLVFGRNGVI